MDAIAWALGKAATFTDRNGRNRLRYLQATTRFVMGASLFGAAAVFSQDIDIVFPTDAGVVNVAKSPYNADTTGKTDATAAIQKAIDDANNGNKIIYLPNGTYTVSNTIKWAPSNDMNANKQKRTILQGQSRNGAVLRLKDNCGGYQDPTSRKAMIWTGKAPAQRFRNGIRNLTIHTGNGNPGAVGVQFIANNQGTMRHVKIISGDGSGVCGMDLEFTNENGPAYIHDLHIEGFDYGIWGSRHLNSMTMEKISLRGQKKAGIFNEHHMLAIHDLRSVNTVPAVENVNGGVLTLVKADLSGGSSSKPAILNDANLYARDITTSGYGQAILNTGGHTRSVNGNAVDEFVSHEVRTLFESPAQSLNLPVEPLPDVPWGPLTEWGNIKDYGAVAGDGNDDGPAIQRAIDAGHTTVYIPNGSNFELLSTVYIRNAVHRIIGCEATLNNGERRAKFILEDGAADVVWFERIDALRSDLSFEKNSSRTLVLSSVTDMELQINAPGKVFLADYVDNTIHINDAGARVWARQLNIEQNCATCIGLQNHGARLWVLGFKTEGKEMDTKLLTDRGGYTEILGCLIYNNSREDHPNPIFRIDNASTSVAGVKYQHFISPPHHYQHWVEETRGTTTRKLSRDANVIQLFAGYAEAPVASMPAQAAACDGSTPKPCITREGSTLRISGASSGMLSLLDLSGKRVLRKNLAADLVVDMGPFGAGLRFLHIETGQGVELRRAVRF